MRTYKLPGLLLTCWLSLYLTLPASAGNLSEGSYGYKPNAVVTPTCGGTGQKDCFGSAATFEGSATGSCPEGTIFNLLTWACYTCPDGYTMSFDGAWDPSSDRACSKYIGPKLRQKKKTAGKSVRASNIANFTKTNTTKAVIHDTVCATGSFYDPIRNGECWSCPPGFDRSLSHIDNNDACIKFSNVIHEKINTFNKGTGVFETDCPAGSGQFWDGWDGKCHSCPAGYKRSIHHIKTDKACWKMTSTDSLNPMDTLAALSKSEKKPATLVKQPASCEEGQDVDPFLAPEQGGTCFSCPATYVRTSSPLKSATACGTETNIAFANATLEQELTCSPGQDFDLINWQHPRVKHRAEAARKANKGIQLDSSNKKVEVPAGAVQKRQQVAL